MTSRRFLGLDMSLASAGIAIIDIVDGELRIVHKQRIKTNPKQRHGERLHKIATELKSILIEYQPFDTIIREQGFSRFAKTTQALFKVVGVSDLVLRDYAIVEISPTTIKLVMTGDGKADKKEVEKAVRKIMRLDDDYIFISDDESDACAIILTHLIQNNIIDKGDK
ncbi:crossover junction endodeoxyribonuclease RuvC [Bacillus mycoides]|uniref:Crossover junction endodeoxyribonuclease RuvC n=1 Tax=Bacillus mycoides (strain KBAB4) TaxID=315730 RepID=A9VVH9_BACMK|nr:crossover junction endodeoxyribonuclease RuvC [Bacillus mycoides]ABY46794.1 crossover junction endodeoxyribonuclease RuvC [Bacillus mycoides KBAB4]